MATIDLNPKDIKSPEHYWFGELEVKSARTSNKMQMSGFVSTPDGDLSNEVVEVNAFDQYLKYYQRNPIYCYNHDKSIPIGRVDNTKVVKDGEKTGLYLENITLSDIPIVKEVLWTLIQDKVLTQQSIGFLSLEGKYFGETYHHQKVYMVESSLVAVACNPSATIDTVKSILGKMPDGYEEFETVNALVDAYTKGVLKLPSEVRKVFAVSQPKSKSEEIMPDNLLDSSNSESSVPDFADAEVIPSLDLAYDPEGDELDKPHRNEKGYVKVCEMIHAAKSTTRGSYLFQLGVPTEKGFKYVWKHVALSMSRVLGGNGGAHFTAEQKSAIIERIGQGYIALGKALPSVDYSDGTVTVDKLVPEAIASLEYKSITFNSGEGDAVRLAFLEKDVKSVCEALASYKKEGDLPAEVKEVLKYIYGYVDLTISVSISDPVALEFMSNMIDMIEEFFNPGSESDTAESPMGVYMSGPEGIRKFADWLIKRADTMEAEEAAKNAPAVQEVPQEVIDQVKQLLDLADQFNG